MCRSVILKYTDINYLWPPGIVNDANTMVGNKVIVALLRFSYDISCNFEQTV